MIVKMVDMSILLQYICSAFPGYVLVNEMNLNDKILHVFLKNMNYSFMALLWSYVACLLIDL